MKYHISYTQPHHHYVDIEFIADNIIADELLVQLPAWRPGRYELGNFAKNVQKWAAYDDNGNPLTFKKITKDCWKIQTKGVSTVHVKYNYYAAELNAGSTWLDATQLYMNPVNCCVYIPERISEPCELVLHLPETYKVACGLPQAASSKAGAVILNANNFHQLADSPFIASDSLKHKSIVCGGVEFNLWFQGECKPDWEQLTADFTLFVNEQLTMMKQFPDNTYHFLFQIVPHKMYHGVEHTNSTVIALGPGYNLMKGKLYEDLLGVSCHELFHAWNVKTIRPVEMQPYNYINENYSRLGYVCEGVTTYYGDYLLFRSKVFNEQQYFSTLEERMQKHFHNFGRYNLSVADSSFDTWLDGYVQGIPNRKTSIYDEGNLLAFVTDIFIRKHSGNKNSLDDVIRYLYIEYALKGKGYSEADYNAAVERFANTSYAAIYNNYICRATDYEPLLKEALACIGCELLFTTAAKYCEHALGIKVSETGGVCKIATVYPNSVADVATLSINDEIVAVNDIHIKPDSSGTTFNEWCNYYGDKPLKLTVVSGGRLKKLELQPQPQSYYKLPVIKKITTATQAQKDNFNKWSNTNF